jgi:uncharacterized membrane protein HdeD (DUF308 family)
MSSPVTPSAPDAPGQPAVPGVLILPLLDAAVDSFSRSWSLLLLRGIATFALGVTLLVWPDVTLVVVVTLVGAYLVLFGVLEMAYSFRVRKAKDRWLECRRAAA